MRDREVTGRRPEVASHAPSVLSPGHPSGTAAWLRETARSLGALDAGCLRRDSPLDSPPLEARFRAWLECGNRDLLSYVDSSIDQRVDPFAAYPWARSVVVTAFAGDWGDVSKAPSLPPPDHGRPSGRVSLYACGPDYHRTGKRLLEALADALARYAGRDVRVQCCVDTAPVPEVFLAVSAGLGARGHNSLLRTAAHGSRVFVGCLFTDLDLPEVIRTPDIPVACSACGRCARQCPTGALNDGNPVRVAQCRSYLTMEYRHAFLPGEQRMLGDCLFGCDACTSACPPVVVEPSVPVDLEWLLTVPAGEVRRRIRGTALERAGVTLLRRNAVAILAQRYADSARPLLDHVLRTSQSRVVLDTIRR